MYGYQTARCVMFRSISTLQSLVFSVYLYIHRGFCSVGFFRTDARRCPFAERPAVSCFSMFFVVFHLFYVLNYFLFFSLRDFSVCARYYFCRACFVSRSTCSVQSLFSFRLFSKVCSACFSTVLFSSFLIGDAGGNNQSFVSSSMTRPAAHSTRQTAAQPNAQPALELTLCSE